MFAVRGRVFAFTDFTCASMVTTIFSTIARRFMTVASVRRFVAIIAAPTAAFALATTTRATLATRIGRRRVVAPVVDVIRAANPFRKVGRAAAVSVERCVSLDTIIS